MPLQQPTTTLSRVRPHACIAVSTLGIVRAGMVLKTSCTCNSGSASARLVVQQALMNQCHSSSRGLAETGRQVQDLVSTVPGLTLAALSQHVQAASAHDHSSSSSGSSSSSMLTACAHAGIFGVEPAFLQQPAAVRRERTALMLLDSSTQLLHGLWLSEPSCSLSFPHVSSS